MIFERKIMRKIVGPQYQRMVTGELKLTRKLMTY
jgi:hypothetical protein